MRWIVGIVGLVLVGVLMAASLRSEPPSLADRMLMLDLAERYAEPVGGTCAIDDRPFTPQARTTFDRLADAVAGVVPRARVRMVSLAEDHSDAADDPGAVRRSVTFEVAPQVLGAFDSPLDTWQWTWSADPRPGEAGNLSDHWSFFERRRNEG